MDNPTPVTFGRTREARLHASTRGAPNGSMARAPEHRNQTLCLQMARQPSRAPRQVCATLRSANESRPNWRRRRGEPPAAPRQPRAQGRAAGFLTKHGSQQRKPGAAQRRRAHPRRGRQHCRRGARWLRRDSKSARRATCSSLFHRPSIPACRRKNASCDPEKAATARRRRESVEVVHRRASVASPSSLNFFAEWSDTHPRAARAAPSSLRPSSR